VYIIDDITKVPVEELRTRLGDKIKGVFKNNDHDSPFNALSVVTEYGSGHTFYNVALNGRHGKATCFDILHYPELGVGQVKKIQIKKTEFKPGETSRLGLDAQTWSHISAVRKILHDFTNNLIGRGVCHDVTKLDMLDGVKTGTWFYEYLSGGLKDPSWWNMHKSVERHHLAWDGVMEDVTLIDIIESLADGVAAGCARRGKENVYMPEIKPELLVKAVENTFKQMLERVEVSE